MSCENCEESAYVIDKLAKLLAEIAVIVNGPEPPLTSWSYHDLPEKVRALKANHAQVAVPAAMVERALRVLAFENDCAVFPDAYSDEEAEEERATMRKVLAAALAGKEGG